MIKIKISYERPEELKQIMARLAPDVKRWKTARQQKGRFKNAYVEMRENLASDPRKPGRQQGNRKRSLHRQMLTALYRSALSAAGAKGETPRKRRHRSRN